MSSELELRAEQALDALPPHHLLFVLEYTKDFCGTAAVLRCPAFKTESPASAKVTASRLLDRPEIQKALQARMRMLSAATGISAKRVLETVRDIAFCDVTEALVETSDGETHLKPLSEIPAAVKRSIKKFKSYSTYNAEGERIAFRSEIEFHDRMAALRMLFTYCGLDADYYKAQRTLHRVETQRRRFKVVDGAKDGSK